MIFYYNELMKPLIQAFHDKTTGTVTYIVYENDGSDCAIIDSVLDYDPKSGRTATASADLVVDFVRAHRLNVVWLLETHAHADHLSAAPYLSRQLGGRTGIGAEISVVQQAFARVFPQRPGIERSFDHLFQPDEVFAIGALQARALHVPGHTPADMAYRVEGAVFVGDTLFMPDVGTARADFPGGDAHQLYRSIHRILQLPPQTVIYVCHDYPPASREPEWQTTVAEQRARNIHVRDGIGEDEFVAMRTARDSALDMPTLILPSIQVNVRAGQLPPPDANGIAYLRIPLNALPVHR